MPAPLFHGVARRREDFSAGSARLICAVLPLPKRFGISATTCTPRGEAELVLSISTPPRAKRAPGRSLVPENSHERARVPRTIQPARGVRWYKEQGYVQAGVLPSLTIG